MQYKATLNLKKTYIFISKYISEYLAKLNNIIKYNAPITTNKTYKTTIRWEKV